MTLFSNLPNQGGYVVGANRLLISRSKSRVGERWVEEFKSHHLTGILPLGGHETNFLKTLPP